MMTNVNKVEKRFIPSVAIRHRGYISDSLQMMASLPFGTACAAVSISVVLNCMLAWLCLELYTTKHVLLFRDSLQGSTKHVLLFRDWLWPPEPWSRERWLRPAEEIMFDDLMESLWFGICNDIGLGIEFVSAPIPISVFCAFMATGFGARDHYFVNKRFNSRLNLYCSEPGLKTYFFNYSIVDVLVLFPTQFLVVASLFSSEWVELLHKLPSNAVMVFMVILLTLITFPYTRGFVLIMFNLLIITPHYFYNVARTLTGISFSDWRGSANVYFEAMLIVALSIALTVLIMRVVHGQIMYLREFAFLGYFQIFLFVSILSSLFIRLYPYKEVCIFFNIPIYVLILAYVGLFLLYCIFYVYGILFFKHNLYVNFAFRVDYAVMTREELATSFNQWREPGWFEGRKYNWSKSNKFYSVYGVI